MEFFKAKGAIYKPVADVNLGPQSDELYLRANVKAPRVAGLLVKVFAWILESRIFGTVLLYILKKDNLIHKLVSFADLEESPMYVPLHPSEDLKEQEVKCVDAKLSPPEQVQHAVDCLQPPEEIHKSSKYSFRRWTILDYSRAYMSREVTPRVVADRFIAAVRESSSSALKMSFFINYDTEDIIRQANESTIRYERGEPISALDGILIAIKDEIDCMPYPTTGGTKWLHKARPCIDDACCVKRLRLCGAILVGKTNMHELGAGTSGINPHYGVARNPYNTSKISGGSSSGSASVVSAGLCPVALGVDGGGSVRMPAALCGVVGLKPSFGRVPHSGVLPLNWTVGMVGILAGTVEDALIAYAAISGHVPAHQFSTTSRRPREAAYVDGSLFFLCYTADHIFVRPKLSFPLLKSPKCVSNIKLAKSEEWFNDCTDDIRVCCSNALEHLYEHYKWETIGVTLPEIEVMRLAHYLTIGSECSSSIACHLEKLDMAEVGWDVRVALAVYGAFNSRDYLNAQRIRNRQMQFHQNIFAKADVIVTPTTGVTAYTIKDDCLESGELDYINGAALVRYQIAGNFLGLPAVTVPVGYDNLGLPIGLQFIGKPWSEPTLIQIAFALQALRISDYRKPQVFYDLLQKE